MLDIQRMYLSRQNEAEKLNVTYFVIEPGSFLEPDVIQGERLCDSDEKVPIVLDESFSYEGISVGDVVFDSSSELEFKVVGFTEDRMYGHTSVGFILVDSYTRSEPP